MEKYRFDKKEHLHELFVEGEWKPLTGTTTIIEILGKVLTWWASGMACQTMGWIKPERDPKNWQKVLNQKEREKGAEIFFESLKTMSSKDYLYLLDKAYKAHNENKKETAQEGTDLHAELEKFVRNGESAKIDWEDPKISDFVYWTKNNVKRFLGSEVHCFDEELFVGGICDFVAELNDNTLAICDFKRSPKAYFNHFVQMGGYHIQLERNGAFDENGKLLFKFEKPVSQYIVFPFGSEKLEPKISISLEDYKNSFKNCVSLYRNKEKYENQIL